MPSLAGGEAAPGARQYTGQVVRAPKTAELIATLYRRQIVRGDARTVSPKLRDAITDLYDAWWDKRAPARTRFERGAATAARKRAIAGNWCAGAGLDDDQLDVPGYRPSQGWKPARGTGIAADIRLPARHPHRKRRGA